MITPASESQNCDLLTRFLERERTARKHAEKLLENISRQLYQSNSELRRSAMLLENEVQRNNAVFETAAEGIVLFDSNGVIETLNPAARQIFGLPKETTGGINICTLVPSIAFCRSTHHECLVAEDLHKQLGDHNEVTGLRADGSEIPLEFVISEYRHNQQTSFSGMVRDLSRRKALETQLAHAQKMESVGQLAAGIAHELNTPIQFVGDNTRFLQTSIESIWEILNLLEEMLPECGKIESLSESAAKINATIAQSDIAFLKEEIPLAISQTLQGAETVSRIVRAMKVFSHPGSEDLQEINLNDAIESTLTISRSEWKYCANVVTEFDQQLPAISCLPGELNQAFLNLIVNAAHAIAAKKLPELGTITIRTTRVGDYVTIKISDTGTGIPAPIQNRIFDPFFTTKGVGKGTGQGLSICYQTIVEQHFGKLWFESTEGSGTDFYIELPINPRHLIKSN